jgi:quinol monooxygenase YgiN
MLIVVIEAVAESADTAARLLAEARPLIAKTRTEQGCVTYAFSQDAIEPSTVRVIERWRDGPAMAAHLKSPHLGQFMAFLQSVPLKSLTAKVYDASGERDLFG